MVIFRVNLDQPVPLESSGRECLDISETVFFTGHMSFLPPSQWRQSTKRTQSTKIKHWPALSFLPTQTDS